jgi:excisionase family DNA binding protein
VSLVDEIREAVADAVWPLKEQVQAQTRELELLRDGLPPRLGTIDDAARVLGCSRRLVERLLHDGEIECVRVGKLVRIDLLKLAAQDEVTQRRAAGGRR